MWGKPKRPPSLEHISEDAAARALSRHFGDFVKAARDLNVKRTDLRKLSWHNPRILDAAHERMDLFIFVQRDEIMSGLNSKVASVRRRAVDRMVANPMLFGDLDHPLAPAPRVRGPRGPNVFVEAERARLAIEREVAAEREMERAAERERDAAAERAAERERFEVMVECRPAPAPTISLWPSHIRRPTRGRRW